MFILANDICTQGMGQIIAIIGFVLRIIQWVVPIILIVLGTIDLDSKELPALSKYKVKVNIDSDIADIYNVVPVTDFEEYGSIGGVEIETK